MDDLIRIHRQWLKDSIRKSVEWRYTDQSRGIPPPPPQKPVPPGALTFPLPGPDRFEAVCDAGLLRVLRTTQGVTGRPDEAAAFRTVPSAGARHAFETYLYCRKVETLKEGIYRYLPLEHRLLFEFSEPGLTDRIPEACFGQRFVGQGAVTFFWSVIPYRMEWRYGPAAHRVIPMDVGHVCQNLYLAAEAIGAGTCAVAAYDQEGLDALLRLDGEEEFVIYLSPVGKRPAGG